MNRAYVIAIGFSALALFGFGPCSKLKGDAQPAESASAAATDPSAAPDPTSVSPPPAPMATAKKDTNKANYKAQLDQMEKDLKK